MLTTSRLREHSSNIRLRHDVCHSFVTVLMVSIRIMLMRVGHRLMMRMRVNRTGFDRIGASYILAGCSSTFRFISVGFSFSKIHS